MKTYSDDEQQKKDEGPPSGYTPRSELPDDPESSEAAEYEVPEKCSVIEQFRISIVSPKQLIGLSTLKVSRFVRYAILLGFLVAVMINIIPTAATIAGFGGFKSLFQDRMPDFIVQDGEMRAEEPYSINLGNYEILIDTTEDVVPQEKYLGKLITIAIGRKRVQVAVSQNGLSEVAIDMPISAYFDEGFNRDMLVSAIPGFYIGLGLIAIFTMVWIIGKYLLAALIYMLLAYALARNSGLGLTRGNVFRLCFYAQTIGILLVNLNQALGYLIPSMIVSAVGIFLTLRWIAKTFQPYFRFSADH